MLGGGGMGSVYRARDQRLGRPVAIKVLGSHPETPNAVARLRREAEAASSLNHPSIVTIYDIGEAPASGLFIAMELIDGVNLREWLREPRSKEQKLEILLQVAAGLAAAHARGIVHRDVKPENIMVTRTGFGKLVDFGLAKVIEPVGSDDKPTDVRLTARGHVVGTIAYMSPEQLRGEAHDPRSDIYSFGCVLRDAFEGDPAFARFIERCTEQDRALRYQSMDAVVLEMQRARGPSRRWLAIAAATLLVIAAA